MLKQRIITAVVLMAILAASLVPHDPLWFALLALVLLAAAGWEWGRLNASAPSVHWLSAVCTLLACIAFWIVYWRAPAIAEARVWLLHAAGAPATRVLAPQAASLWWFWGVCWILGGLLLLRAGVAGWPRWPLVLRVIFGVAALALAWAAIVAWRRVGVNALLSVLALVWAADIGAYVAGRLFGRHKLAPSISPGKSWEGVIGGWVAVALLAVLWLAVDHAFAAHLDSASFYSLLREFFGGFGMVLAIWALACMSVVGDLAESLVKRSAGMKDSSQLLPGHGGVLDRIDALLPTLPLSMLLLVLGLGRMG